MADASTHGAHEAADHAHDAHGPRHYIKIWAILLVLLVISVAGPFLEIQIITLLTAFGIAVVKAAMVCKYFMHLDVQPKYVIYFLVTALVFMALFFMAVAPDVMHHEGVNWSNVAAKEEVTRALVEQHHVAAAECDHEEAEDITIEPLEAANTFVARGCDASTVWSCVDGECTQLDAAAAGVFDPAAAFAQTCSPCHGEGGAGDGPAAAALDPRPANFTDPAFWAQDRITHDHIVSVITHGGAANGRSALMAAFGSQFSAEEIEALATYLESLNPAAE